MNDNNHNDVEFTQVKITNNFVNALPADDNPHNFTRQVEHSAYSFTLPKKTVNAKLIAVTESLATEIGFSTDEINSSSFKKVLSGNEIFNNSQPFAMCYGGHQFGHWAGQLGDGRAINLGEVKTVTGKQLSLQLKGAGPTPYSRQADGLAVLRSSVREFLCSEAMFNLGIPTTRALSLCLTGDMVLRDMFYDGNAKEEFGAVVCRVSPSFLRFGSFQLPSNRQDINLLKEMLAYSIRTNYSHLLGTEQANNTNNEFTQSIYLDWFAEIALKTCEMVVNWARVGFVHGVMNTDNMSIIGETIDYGPYGWIDAFDLDWTPNTTDKNMRRYRFGAQAEVAQWNLFQLANAILPVVKNAAPLEKILNDFAKNYQQQWQKMMVNKLGLTPNLTTEENTFIIDLENLLGATETDMTIFYRLLAQIPFSSDKNIDLTINNEVLFQHFSDCFYSPNTITENYKQQFFTWFTQYFTRLELELKNIGVEERREKMNSVNPKYVLRNYLAQQAITLAEKGNFSELHRLQEILKNPYDEQSEYEQYANKRPDWAKNKAGCSMLSCSS